MTTQLHPDAPPQGTEGSESRADEVEGVETIEVMRPGLPELDDFVRHLGEIWRRRWLTNNGEFHQELEHRIADYLGVQHVSLFCNGTMALWTAIQVLELEPGEVITTPFTFPATPHAIKLSGLEPVFCDVEASTLNIDPARVEEAIGPRTRAILPVHVYGTPCRLGELEDLADRHGLPLFYDAAHTFGAFLNERALASWGDLSMLSFHATKVFSTIEGGALVFSKAEQKRRADLLKNFGIRSAEQVDGLGLNAKMNELQAAFGLLQLDRVEDEIEARTGVAEIYHEELSGVPGLRTLEAYDGLRRNWAYFPVFVDPEQAGTSRDRMYRQLASAGVKTRKYFYPLCSTFDCYRSLPSSDPERLPVATRAADEVLCLPMYGDLVPQQARKICSLILDMADCAVRPGG